MALVSSLGIFTGPPKLPMKCASLYEGFGVSRAAKEYGRASHAELSRIVPTPPVYSDRPPRRLLPNAGSCAKGDAAPLFTLPLTSNPSAAPNAGSAGGASGGAEAFAGAAGTFEAAT